MYTHEISTMFIVSRIAIDLSAAYWFKFVLARKPNCTAAVIWKVGTT